jgi:hypothetical protein
MYRELNLTLVFFQHSTKVQKKKKENSSTQKHRIKHLSLSVSLLLQPLSPFSSFSEGIMEGQCCALLITHRSHVHKYVRARHRADEILLQSSSSRTAGWWWRRRWESMRMDQSTRTSSSWQDCTSLYRMRIPLPGSAGKKKRKEGDVFQGKCKCNAAS